jgi:hypothetical protein
MSAQTIIHPSITSIKEESEKLFIQNADKYLFKRRFELGEGYCSYEQFDAAIIYDIIQANDCELLTLIKKELERYEDDETIKKKCSTELTQTSNLNLYELWLSRGNIGTMNDFLNLILADEKANWDEISW